jgi:hypothetical protein
MIGQVSFSDSYYAHIAQARDFREQGRFRESGQAYDSAFFTAGGKGRPADLYLAVRQGKWAR